MHFITKNIFWCSISCAVLIFFTSALHAQDNVTQYQNDVFISNWSITGPFPNADGKNVDTDFLANVGGEDKLIWDSGLTHPSESVPSGQVGWISAKADDTGKLDIKKHLSPNYKNVAYCAAYIECDKITPAILKLGSNDRLKVRLNGKLVHIFAQPRAGGSDTDQVPIELRKGKNMLLAKVDNDGGNWWLYARFDQLESIDGELFMTKPLMSSVPKKMNNDTVADIFNVLLYNTASLPSGPVTMKVEANKSRLEQSVTSSSINAKEYIWLTLESPVDIAKSKSMLEADLTVSSKKGSSKYKLEAKRQDIMDGKVFFVQAFHVDPVWRDSQAGYQKLTFSNFTQHLSAAQSDPTFDFFVHEIPYLKPYYDSYPKARPVIRKMVKEGRIETGGSYNQPNETSISGEAFIRNILYGRLFHENVLGDYPRAYTPWDVFGHIIQLPQILAKSEFIGTTWERGNYRSPFVRVPDVPDLYRALSPDGTSILTRKVGYSFNGPQTGQYRDIELQTRKLMADDLVDQQTQIPGLKSGFLLNAQDEKAPTSWIVGHTEEFKSFIPEVSTAADGAEQYFRDVQDQIDNDKLDIPLVSRDESQYNEGCELSRFDLKMGNRLAENAIISAEKFATISNLLGNKYPAMELDKAWRQLLYGQHHDGITGCGADVPYLDLVEAYHEALELSWQALEKSMHDIAKKATTNTQKGIPILVYNPLNWQRTDVVKKHLEFPEGLDGFHIVDQNGKEVDCILESIIEINGKIREADITFIASNVPSIGYKAYWIAPSNTTPASSIQDVSHKSVIENQYYKLTVDKNAGGGITSLIDKNTGKEFINPNSKHPGNEMILLKEGDGFEPAWRFLTTGEKRFSNDKACEIEVYENPIYKKIVITGEMERMEKRVQEIIVYNDLPRIDFRTSMHGYEGLNGKNIRENDDRERRNDRDLYCIGFPANLKGAIPVLEDRFATKTYFHSKENLSYTSTNTVWTSNHAMNSSHQWMDYSNSVTVKFGEAGSIALGPVEVITSRSDKTRKSGYKLIESLATKGITATPSFDNVIRDYDIQYRRFSFSIGIDGENAYNNQLLYRLSKEQKRQYKKSLNDNGYTYLFVYDPEIEGSWFDLPVLMIIGIDETSTLLAVNNITEELRQSSELNFPSSICYSKVNNIVPDHGLALFNKGNMPVSVEQDGTMVMALMHTVPWQSPLLNWTHDFPERKTHVFEYSLLPHQGNWRHANLVWEGYEYNNPLIAIQTEAHDGEFPPAHSFFSTSDNTTVITALKPTSQGVEAFKANTATDATNGIIARLYEPYGQHGKVTVHSDFDIKEAKKVNLMERKPEKISFTNNSLSMDIGPNSIETFSLTLDHKEQTASREKKMNPPVYAQFWEHNEGAAPTGYLPVSIKILGELKSFSESKFSRNVQQLEIAVINDFTDSSVSGRVKIKTPPGLRAVPEEISYNIDANSESFYPVSIVLENSGSEPGFIIASLTYENNEVYDVMGYNLPEKKFGHDIDKMAITTKLNWQVIEKDGNIELTVSNPFAQPVVGYASIIGPVETWGLKEVNPISISRTSPWKQTFEVPALSSKTINYKVEPSMDKPLKKGDIWLVAKLAYFGYVEYKSVVGELEIID